MNHESNLKLNLVVNDNAKNRWVNLCQWNEPIKETNGDDTLHFHLGFEITLWSEIFIKYFLSFPQKNLSPEKTETNQVFTFQFLNDKMIKLTKK